jgi:hypothetical protein
MKTLALFLTLAAAATAAAQTPTPLPTPYPNPFPPPAFAGDGLPASMTSGVIKLNGLLYDGVRRPSLTFTGPRERIRQYVAANAGHVDMEEVHRLGGAVLIETTPEVDVIEFITQSSYEVEPLRVSVVDGRGYIDYLTTYPWLVKSGFIVRAFDRPSDGAGLWTFVTGGNWQKDYGALLMCPQITITRNTCDAQGFRDMMHQDESKAVR